MRSTEIIIIVNYLYMCLCDVRPILLVCIIKYLRGVCCFLLCILGIPLPFLFEIVSTIIADSIAIEISTHVTSAINSAIIFLGIPPIFSSITVFSQGHHL